MQVKKGENLMKYGDEIMSRPKRTWFESEKEKKIAKLRGAVELNGEGVGKKGKKVGKLSGKQKKRLDDHRERVEGKMWKKGKGDATGVKAGKGDKKGLSKAKKGKSTGPRRR